jgi:hypothetical protein
MTERQGLCDDEGALFISYAKDDSQYATRLSAQLRDNKLPAWMDLDVSWGSRFPLVIQDRIATACALIVVMSEFSVESRWVETEILEGQRNDRVILPIQLRGPRHFLLGSTQAFDARGGRLLTEVELTYLRSLRTDGTGQAGGSGRSVYRPAASAPSPVSVGRAARRADDSLTKKLGTLRGYLADAELVHADIVTTAILLAAAGREEIGRLSPGDAGALPYDLLTDIDDVWARFTHGAQGFAVQLRMYPGPPKGVRTGSGADFTALAEQLGWRGRRRDTTPRYRDFTSPPQHPPGFFPTLRNPQLEQHHAWYDRWQQTALAVHRRLRRWDGAKTLGGWS